ncbi:MerR family transcriptional regulator [Acinetobacter shaoyimingii]|uniref:MerR family transcriptional regulator n=1 Tax=Acinetobacter shaoyimingii TaxID=2715164 RepID=A0A6G8RRG8_9GAMM|nr:MerR family transcriptional regulator [Acinetobacter shaoyimingii]QIO04467.1 MerR family transcriptional regulator [Acinetobacter shaoyimingii]
MKEIDIGDLSLKAGLSTATIRFYESKGLIKSIGRKGLRRQYSEHTLLTLSFIQLLKKGGLSLKEIDEIFICNGKINVDRGRVDEKSADIEDKIENLKNLLSVLQHIKNCPYNEHLSCPDFLKMLN